MKKQISVVAILLTVAAVLTVVACQPRALPEASAGGPGTEQADPTSGGSASPVSRVSFADDARPDDGTRFVSWDTASTIPLLASREDTADPSLVTFCLGLWSIDKGTVSIEDESLFTVSTPCRVFWDGTDRFVVAPREAGDAQHLQVTVNDRRLSVEVIELRLSMLLGHRSVIAALPDDRATAYAYRESLESGTFLEVVGGPLEGKVELVPPDLAGEAVLGPVAVDTGSPSQVVVCVETSKVVTEGNMGYTLCSILAATWDGKDVSWRVVARDLDINEAGPGSRMNTHAGSLAISDWRGVRLLDLAEGELKPLPELDASMAAFTKEFVKQTEWAEPADPASYGDFLLILWDIPSVEDDPDMLRFIPTTYLAAVRDGKVVGEVKRVRDRMWVEKDGAVTAEIDVPPVRWVLPR